MLGITMLWRTSRTATLASCLALLSLLSRRAAFVFQRSLSPGYGGVITGKHEVQQVATQAELEQILSDSGDALVVLDFTATWCSPCQKIAPEFEQLSQELTDVVFLKIDVDENEETAQKYEVFQMPTFLFMKKGEVVEQFSGANIAVLRQRIDRLS